MFPKEAESYLFMYVESDKTMWDIKKETEPLKLQDVCKMYTVE